MQRNYPRMFSPADDQDKDGFKLENVGPTGFIEDTISLNNITDKILLALKFELIQKYSAEKSRHC